MPAVALPAVRRAGRVRCSRSGSRGGTRRRVRSRRCGRRRRGRRPTSRDARARRRRPGRTARGRRSRPGRPRRRGRGARGRSPGCRCRRSTTPSSRAAPGPGPGSGTATVTCSTVLSPGQHDAAHGRAHRPLPASSVARAPCSCSDSSAARYSVGEPLVCRRGRRTGRGSPRNAERVRRPAAARAPSPPPCGGPRPRSARRPRRRPRRTSPRPRPRAPTGGTAPPCASWCRTTGTSHLGIRSELSAHSRASVSLISGLANRSMSWCL